MVPITEALSVVAVALLVIYVTWRFLFSGARQKLNLPPGPSPLPIIGSLHLLGTLPHQSLADLSKTYGPLMSVRLGQNLFIVATSPETAREFFKVQDAIFCFRPPVRAAEVLFPNDVAFSDFTPVNLHMRKIFVREITSPRRREISRDIRADEIAYVLRMVSRETDPIRIKTYCHIISTNMASRIILGKRFLGEGDHTGDVISTAVGSDAFEFISITKGIVDMFGAIHPQDYFNFLPKWFDPQRLEPRFRALRQRMDKFYTKLIDEHKEHRKLHPVSDDKKSFLDVLLQELDNPNIDLTDEHVSSLIWDALFGATDTTIVTSEWAMTEVLRNPSVLEEIRAELDRVVGGDRVVREADLPNLPYIQAMVKETFRLHPPIPMLLPHRNLQAAKAFGYDIPAKSRLFVNSYGIARDPKVWENPLEFQPKRFLEGGSHGGMELLSGQQFDVVPFGSGRRVCPGASSGIMSVTMQVASLFHAFDLSCAGGPENLNLSEVAGLVVHKRDSLIVLAKPRLPSHLY